METIKKGVEKSTPFFFADVLNPKIGDRGSHEQERTIIISKKNIFNKRIDLQKQVYSMEASMAVERKKHKQLH